MSLICGIDYSTRAVDVVLLDEDTDRAEWHRCELFGTDAFERARKVGRVLRSMGSLTDMFEDTLAIGIEEPRGYNSGALYRVQGAILACLPRMVLVQPWVPSGWRKAVGLPGNCSKEAVAEYAIVRGQAAGIQDWYRLPFDVTDAYCIALATRQALQREEAA